MILDSLLEYITEAKIQDLLQFLPLTSLSPSPW